jgi:hypothetical protein
VYNGGYHDIVVARLAAIFRSEGIPTEVQVPLVAIGSKVPAIADIIIKNPGTGQIFIIEVKTGDSPKFTFGQAYVYPLATLGDHVSSPSLKILTFGFLPNEPLPPIEVDQVYAKPGEEYKVTPVTPEFSKIAKLFLSEDG